MAIAEMLSFATAIDQPESGWAIPKAGNAGRHRVQEFNIVNMVRPRSKENSSAAQVSIPESSGDGGDMRMVRVPESFEKKVSIWSEINQTWEGRVIENSPENREFVAIISDRTCRENPEEEVVIGYESIIESDIGLISEGAVFFWNVGKYRKFSEVSGKIGPAVNRYELRFRRLPPISKETIEEIKNLSKGLSKIIHGH